MLATQKTVRRCQHFGRFCQHPKTKQACDLRKHCARGGTRAGFQPLNFRHSPENLRNPAQSGTSTTRSEAQGVHNVHTLFLARFWPQPSRLVGRPGGAVVSCTRFRADIKSRPPEPGRTRTSTALRDVPHAGNRRTAWRRITHCRTSHGEANSNQHDRLRGPPDRTNGDGVDRAFDAAGVAHAVQSALECLDEHRPPVSVAISKASPDAAPHPRAAGAAHPRDHLIHRSRQGGLRTSPSAEWSRKVSRSSGPARK